MGALARTDNPNDGTYSCLSCHDETNIDGVIGFTVTRDCNACHIQTPGTPTPHHLDESVTGAKAGQCVKCHGTVVDDPPGCMDTRCDATGSACVYDTDCDAVNAGDTCVSVGPGVCEDEHVIPTYAPSLVTPEPSNDPATPGNCNYCHDAGIDATSGVHVVDNYNTHHGTGVYKDRMGDVWDAALCGWCHKERNPYNPGGDDVGRIRNCESCHGMESLHSIQSDSDGNVITVGGELPGYGHVGVDDPNDNENSDCWGCHGFSIAAAAEGSEVISPSISSVTPNVIVANTAASVIVLGNAFTNDAYTSTIELTPVSGGAVVNIEPFLMSANFMIANINVDAGSYALRAVKPGVNSGEVIITVKPETTISITNIQKSCGNDCKGTAVITGSGFGDAPPAGADEWLNVMEGDVILTIESWTDTHIEVTGVMCDGNPITVNALMGSATK
jgi:hypothetical protein